MGHYRGLAQGLALPRAVQAVGGSPGLPAVPRGTESARPRARQARRRPFCRCWAAEGSSSGTKQFPAETGPCQDRLSCAKESSSARTGERNTYYLSSLAHRARAAMRAITDLRLFDSFLARAFPPMLAKRRAACFSSMLLDGL